MSSRTWSLVLACLAVVAIASPAQAVTRFRIARGEAPGVAVDAPGAAHRGFHAGDVNGGGPPPMYCAGAQGPRRCTPRAIPRDGPPAAGGPPPGPARPAGRGG